MFFPERLPSVTSVPGSWKEEERQGCELAPGVIVERRHFLWSSAALAWLLGSSTCIGKEAATTIAEDALGKIHLKARELLGCPRPDEEAYVKEVAELLPQLVELPTCEFSGRSGWKSALVYSHMPLVAMQIKMEPRSKILLHDHRNYNGVLLGLEGEAQVSHFDYVDPVAAEVSLKPFIIRQTRQGTLRKGDVSTLCRQRDNLHEVIAGPEGTRLFDLFTYFSKDAASHELLWSGKPVKAGKPLFEAEWKHRPKRN